jgi:hypothetical protein
MLSDDRAKLAMRHNILEMALGFTAMIRVFSPGSNQQITGKLSEFVAVLHQIQNAVDFEDRHREFCSWFCDNIRTAEKRLARGAIKPSVPASFGQAAKVLDISLKVIIHYCAMPSTDVAHRLLPFLHGAIDTPILAYLRQRPSDTKIIATRIAEIDEDAYRVLQLLLKRDLDMNHADEISPVEYDDILWRRLNRSTPSSD